MFTTRNNITELSTGSIAGENKRAEAPPIPNSYPNLNGHVYLQILQAIAQEKGWQNLKISEKAKNVHISNLSEEQAEELLQMFATPKNKKHRATKNSTNQYTIEIPADIITQLLIKHIQEFLVDESVSSALPPNHFICFTSLGSGTYEGEMKYSSPLHYKYNHNDEKIAALFRHFLFGANAGNTQDTKIWYDGDDENYTYLGHNYGIIFSRFGLVQTIINRGRHNHNRSQAGLPHMEYSADLSAAPSHAEIKQVASELLEKRTLLIQKQAKMFRLIYAALLAGQSGLKKDTSDAFANLSDEQFIHFVEKKSRQSGNGRTKEAWLLTKEYFNSKKTSEDLLKLTTKIYTTAFSASLFGRSQVSGKTFYRSSSLASHLKSEGLKNGFFSNEQINKGKAKINSRMQKICAALKDISEPTVAAEESKATLPTPKT